MTTVVGDSIRSMIGKPKKKSDQEIGRRDLQGSQSRIGGRTLRTGCAAPDGVMEIDLPGGGAVRKRRRLGLGPNIC